MKKNLLYLGLTGYLLFALCTRLQAQTDSLQAHRYVTRATMYGVGFTNVFDTYLSPQEYKGIDFRISRETIRMTKLFDGNVSVQNFFQADVGYTHNRADNNNTFSGLVNWNYGLHYQFRLTENFKLLAGGLFDVNGGFVYNLRNSNNPASARAYVNLDASGMAIWHLKIKRYPMVLRYQVNVPILWTRTERLRMRNRIIQLLLLLCCLPIQTGCIGEDDYADDPVGNFEQLWKIIDERYCFLDSKGIDWDAVHEKYSKLIVPGMSNDDLFDKLSEMLYILKDGHVNLSSAKRVSYYDAWYQGYPWNYREDILYQYYLGSASKDYYTSAGMKYKIFDNNIGYIRYESFSSGVGDGNLDEILVYLATCNGLIIDVRDNGGGNLTNSSRIAARFTNSKILTGFIQHKTGTGHSDFSQPEPIYLEPSNSIRWQKKVVILTNRRCYSATNDFVNLMRSIDNGNIIQVGDQTGGGSGLPFTSELPNGWSIRFSASPHFDKNMQPLEEGILPDIAIDMTEDDQSKHRDTLIEKAFEILSE